MSLTHFIDWSSPSPYAGDRHKSLFYRGSPGNGSFEAGPALPMQLFIGCAVAVDEDVVFIASQHSKGGQRELKQCGALIGYRFGQNSDRAGITTFVQNYSLGIWYTYK